MKPIAVSQLNGYIKKILLNDPLLGSVRVIGEISNLTYHSTGHIYFNLKDDKGRVSCFFSAQNAGKLDFILEEGMEIIAEGYVSVYEKGGAYSLNIRNAELAGRGRLAVLFEQLKSRLEKEGLFDAAHKKPLPHFPKKIAIVTSPTGAAVHDMLKVIKGRNPLTDVIVFPVQVQGDRAPQEIADMIDFINSKSSPITSDVMIVGRGGGSAEELWSFNEEVVARAIFNSNIPVISAVGHEVDYSISDFVADARAATPTAAAVMAVPDVHAMMDAAERTAYDLYTKLLGVCRRFEGDLNARGTKFFQIALERSIAEKERDAEDAFRKVNAALDSKLWECERKIIDSKNRLTARDPHRIMGAGYGAVLDETGRLKGSAADFKPRDTLTIEFSDGEVVCIVENVIFKER